MSNLNSPAEEMHLVSGEKKCITKIISSKFAIRWLYRNIQNVKI